MLDLINKNMEKQTPQNVWKYFFIGGAAGPTIAAILNSFGLALSSPSNFLVIIFTLPVFLIIGFIPSGPLGICTFFMVKMKRKPHPTLLILLGGVYGFIFRFSAMFCFTKNKILKDIFLDMFSNKANTSEWIPFLSNVWYTWIFIISGALTCILLQRIFIKKSNKTIQRI